MTGTFYCHVNQGASFTPVTGLIFPGTVDIFEREFLLLDFNGDGVADVVSHDLRSGDITVLPVFRNSAGEKAARTIFDLKKQCERPPGKPYVTYYDASTGKLAFQSANWPTQYCVSTDPGCPEGAWHYVDVRSTCPLQSAGGSSFYLLTRNPFGTSAAVMVSGTQGTLPPSCH